MTSTTGITMSFVYTKDIAAALPFHVTFRNRKYRNGKTVVFMYVEDARYPYIPHDLLSYQAMSTLVHLAVPGAVFTSGGPGNGTFRLPDNVVHVTDVLPRKAMDQAYRKLHRFTFTICRKDGTHETHVQKDRGDREPLSALRRAFAALAQLIEDGDRNVVIAVINRGSQKVVYQSPIIALA